MQMEIRISVRALVEFLLRSGDIDNRRKVNSEEAMLEGSRIHRMIQQSMGPEYHPEVALRFEKQYEHYTVVIDGRADGIIFHEHWEEDIWTTALLQEEHNYLKKEQTQLFSMECPENKKGEWNATDIQKTLVIIDEIKGTYKDLQYIYEPEEVHLAQAKCYAYFYAIQHQLDFAGVRMTYCNMDSDEKKYFHYNYTVDELHAWFESLMSKYKKWTDFEYEWKQKRKESAKQLEFPYEYRAGQKELAGYVYTSLVRQRKLFIQAPTGVGKTLSTVFPTVKAIGEGKGDKIFYLTAKTITRTVAEEAFERLREKGLQFKTVVLTAKEKICFMEEKNCNPESCPYACGHFERINDAIFDLLTSKERFSRSKIEEYALKHKVCPFEMSLDMSLFSDAIICDYNYLFDPRAYLRRYFTEGQRGEYYFLVDEAHNLVDRGREMYSAKLCKEDFLELKREIKDYKTKLEHPLDRCNKELLVLKKQCESFMQNPAIGNFTMALSRLYNAINTYLEEDDDSPVREKILEFYFEISRFLEVYEQMDDKYVVYSEFEESGRFIVKEFCVDPSKRLYECMQRGLSTILFSATLLPIQYYKSLLGGNMEDYEVYAHSTFDPNKRGLFIGNSVTSKYTRRGPKEYYNIAEYIHKITKQKLGNYIIFFPSHQFLTDVYKVYMEQFYEEEKEECIVQKDYMKEEDREAFLQRFMGMEDRACVENAEEAGEISCVIQNGTQLEEASWQDLIKMEIEIEQRNLLGFCVLGGIFSEGIDLKKDSLIGAIIVGTGLPQVCHEREFIKQYFDEQGENGYDYAYKYPGMNKVLQAAGRVIRTHEDVGVVALLDERFMERSYQKMFPREWENYKVAPLLDCDEQIEGFWEQMAVEESVD